MKRLKQALGLSLIFTLYIMCFYYAFAIGMALVEGTSVAQAVVNSVVVAAFLFCAITFALYELYRFVDDRDRILDEERKKHEKSDQPRPPNTDAPSDKESDSPSKE
jgi:hypothetical protein